MSYRGLYWRQQGFNRTTDSNKIEVIVLDDHFDRSIHAMTFRAKFLLFVSICVPPNNPITACSVTSFPGYHSFPKWAIPSLIRGESGHLLELRSHIFSLPFPLLFFLLPSFLPSILHFFSLPPLYYIFVCILLFPLLNGPLLFHFFFSITEVQRDVEYRVTFNVGNSTVFLNMYETETFFFQFTYSIHSLECLFEKSICNFVNYSLVICMKGATTIAITFI